MSESDPSVAQVVSLHEGQKGDHTNTTTTSNTGSSEPNKVLGIIPETETAYTHIPEHGISIFLAHRTKTIHCIRHAEGYHNAINQQYGNDTPVTYTTPNAWNYQDAKLTPHGIEQCVTVRQTMIQQGGGGGSGGSSHMNAIRPELIVVSPFTRTLQTAHLLFSSQRIPFIVHDLCGERRGKYTCDKRRNRIDIINEIQPLYTYTNEHIDFISYGYQTEEDILWTTERESDKDVTRRCIHMMQWLGSRPEKEIAIVTHSSWLKHLFHAFGQQHSSNTKDQEKLHRLSGNAEIRSITLALHHGFYPDGTWIEETKDGTTTSTFVPTDHSFRTGRYTPTASSIAHMHQRLGEASATTMTGSTITNTTNISNRSTGSTTKQEQFGQKEHESMPY